MNIGGDYGGDSFKLMLQIANVTEANSKRNTCLITIASCKDSHENLKIILKPYREQISNLEKTSWKGKRIHVFLFGDYDFELKVYGISGAQSVHLCLWWKASKEQMQILQSDQPEISKGQSKTSNKIIDNTNFMEETKKEEKERLTKMWHIVLYSTSHFHRWSHHNFTFS